jgi:hypothetical protein
VKDLFRFESDELMLIFGGKQLLETDTIATANVSKGSKIFVTTKPKDPPPVSSTLCHESEKKLLFCSTCLKTMCVICEHDGSHAGSTIGSFAQIP